MDAWRALSHGVRVDDLVGAREGQAKKDHCVGHLSSSILGATSNAAAFQAITRTSIHHQERDHAADAPFHSLAFSSLHGPNACVMTSYVRALT